MDRVSLFWSSMLLALALLVLHLLPLEPQMITPDAISPCPTTIHALKILGVDNGEKWRFWGNHSTYISISLRIFLFMHLYFSVLLHYRAFSGSCFWPTPCDSSSDLLISLPEFLPQWSSLCTQTYGSLRLNLFLSFSAQHLLVSSSSENKISLHQHSFPVITALMLVLEERVSLLHLARPFLF